jgi:DNA-binding transcriptional regulator YiaG
MTPSNRVFGSADPVARRDDPLAHFGEPMDQASEKPVYGGPPWIAGEEIRAMREQLRFTQRQFAGFFGFSAGTLRHWERGNRRPTGLALVLLCVIRENRER